MRAGIGARAPIGSGHVGRIRFQNEGIGRKGAENAADPLRTAVGECAAKPKLQPERENFSGLLDGAVECMDNTAARGNSRKPHGGLVDSVARVHGDGKGKIPGRLELRSKEPLLVAHVKPGNKPVQSDFSDGSKAGIGKRLFAGGAVLGERCSESARSASSGAGRYMGCMPSA